jgi:hypothetical protein
MTSYALRPPREVSRSRRGAGIVEYRIRVSPDPPAAARREFNASRPPGVPPLQSDGFHLICPREEAPDRLTALAEVAVGHLLSVTGQHA